MKDKTKSTSDALVFLRGGGEMGALMRSFDFSATPLGPAAEWPQSLRSAVSICLNSRFPIVLFWGPQFVSLYNDAYVPILGSKHPWALGKPFEVVWADIWDVLGPVLRGVVETGVASWAEDQQLIFQRSGYPEEVYFTFSFGAGRNEGGDVGGIFCAVTETTPRVLHERRLAILRELTADATTTPEAARIIAEVLDHTPDIPFALLYLKETDGLHAVRLSHCGLPERSTAAPARIDLSGEQEPWPLSGAQSDGMVVLTDLDRRIGPLPGRPWPESATSAAMIPLKRAGQLHAAGFLILGISPRRAFDEAYRRFFELVGNHVAAMVSNARAYEDERRRAEALAELDRAKTQFFSNVSHEFRTPLTLLLGPVEDALRRPEQVLKDEPLQSVHRNAVRLLKLVNTLLDFSRIEAGRIHAAFEKVDLPTLTGDLASVFRSAIERAGLRFVVDCQPVQEEVYVDRSMWEKIVLNLLSNAFKFTFEGEIAIRLRKENECVRLEVCDTGTGIPSAEMPRIFERFHRVQGARARTHEGSGIGLALVQELVKMHGGTISAESVEGKGTTFRVELPTGGSHLPSDGLKRDAPASSTALGVLPFLEEARSWELDGSVSGEDLGKRDEGVRESARILLADDNADMRRYIQGLLAGRWSVEVVPDGEAALKRVRENPPDLVLSDVMMPRLDGLGLLRALRADEKTRTIPVILVSARAGDEAKIEGLDWGADDYLVKPFSAKELLARVSAHLKLFQLRKEAEDKVRTLNASLEEKVKARTSELTKAVADLESFSYTIAHDLRTPLRTMRSFGEILLGDFNAQLGDDGRDAACRIVESAKRMDALTTDLLAYGRVTQAPRAPESIDLDQIASEVLSAFQAEIKSTSASVKVAQPLGQATATRTLVSQALTNLLSNAFKFVKPGQPPRVEIGSETDGRKVKLWVRDEGIGIAHQHQDKLFGIFERLEPDLFPGTGIGLAIVRKAAERMGGRAGVESEDGQGSRFWIELPAAGEAP